MKIDDLKDLWRKTYEDWQDWLTEAEEDARMYLGDQWSDADKTRLKNENRPFLSINNIHKPVELITGYQRQNRTDLKVYPIEGSDQPNADVYSEVIKWILEDRGVAHYESLAFDNAVIHGIGWMHPRMDFSEDIVNGDIVMTSESPFRILPDPEFCQQDLSDCNYILRHAWMSRQTASFLYPEHASAIEKLKGGNADWYYSIMEPTTRNNDTHVNVIEKWYREYKEKNFIVNLQTLEVEELDAKGKKLAYIKEMIDSGQMPEMTIIKRRVPEIRMYAAVEDIEVYNDVSPYLKTMYPFIPVFGFFTPAFNEWQWKLFGIPRLLKDSQREKNKRRSQLMAAILKMPLSGFIIDKMAVDDPSTLEQAAASGKVIERNPGKNIDQIEPPKIPQALMALEEAHSRDLREIGPNPDLLGATEQGSGKSAPGITLQLRQRQGLIGLQRLYENLSFSRKMLGKYFISMINEHFTDEKIQRILGRPLPPTFAQQKGQARYDCVIDEIVNNPTYRMANFMVLTGMMERGFPIPIDAVLEASDLPQTTKEKILQYIQQQQQAAGPGGPGGAPQGGPPPPGEPMPIPEMAMMPPGQ